MWALVLLLSNVAVADLDVDQLQPFKAQVFIPDDNDDNDDNDDGNSDVKEVRWKILQQKSAVASNCFSNLQRLICSDGSAPCNQWRSGGKGDCTGKPDGEYKKRNI